MRLTPTYLLCARCYAESLLSTARSRPVGLMCSCSRCFVIFFFWYTHAFFSTRTRESIVREHFAQMLYCQSEREKESANGILISLHDFSYFRGREKKLEKKFRTLRGPRDLYMRFVILLSHRAFFFSLSSPDVCDSAAFEMIKWYDTGDGGYIYIHTACFHKK